MSTPAATYEKPSVLITPLSLGEERRRWSGNVIRFQGKLELHLVHLQLLRHRHRVRAVEAGAAELLRRTTTDRAHETRDRQVLQAVGADPLADLLHGATRSDQLLGRAYVDA